MWQSLVNGAWRSTEQRRTRRLGGEKTKERKERRSKRQQQNTMTGSASIAAGRP